MHLWGAKSIVERIGYKRPERLGEYRRTLGVPCYLRRDPRCSWRRIYYSNEALILAWELARCRAEIQRQHTEQEAKPIRR